MHSKTNKLRIKIILIALIIGILSWIVDAVIDYFLFFDTSFNNVLFLHLTTHMLFERIMIIITFLVFGIYVSSLYVKQRKVEITLRESEERFRLVSDFAKDWEYWITKDRQISYVSPSVERITGYTAEEFIANKKLLQEITKTEYADKVNSHFIDENNKDAPIFSMEILIITKNGEERWLMHNCSPILDDNGKYIGRRGTNRDITKRKLAEEDLEKRYNELLLFNEVTVDREIKMIELKKEINEFLEKSGKKPKYEIPV